MKFSISKFGGCPRALVAEQLGHKPADPLPELEITAEEGRRHEPWIAEDVRKRGYLVSEGAKCEKCGRDGIHVEFELGFGNQLVGHLDRVAQHADEILFGEFKALSRFRADQLVRAVDIGPEEFEKEFPEYAWQVSGYHHATGWKALYVVKSRDTGALEIRELEDRYYIPVDRFNERAVWIAEQVAAKQLPVCTYPVGDFFREKVCPFRYMSEDVVGVPWTTRDPHPVLTPEQIKVIQSLGNEYVDKTAEIAKLTKRADEIKGELSKHVDENQKRFHIALGNSRAVTVVYVAGYSYSSYPKEALLKKFGAAALKDVERQNARDPYVRVDIKED